MKTRFILSQTNIHVQNTSSLYLDKETNTLNVGFVKGKFDYNQQLTVKVGHLTIGTTDSQDFVHPQVSDSFLINFVEEFNKGNIVVEKL